MSTPTASPFRTRTVLLLIAAGLALTLGFLLVNGYGGIIDRQRGNAPSPASRFATGFRALNLLIERSGGAVTLSGDAAARPQHGLLILTPNLQTKPAELEAALKDASGPNAPVLIILPKWLAAPKPLQANREERVAALTPDTLARLMAQIGFQGVRTPKGEPQRWVWKGLTPRARPKPPPRDTSMGRAFAALAEFADE